MGDAKQHAATCPLSSAEPTASGARRRGLRRSDERPYKSTYQPLHMSRSDFLVAPRRFACPLSDIPESDDCSSRSSSTRTPSTDLESIGTRMDPLCSSTSSLGPA